MRTSMINVPPLDLKDKQINKNVHKIRGKIAATNYLRIPKYEVTPYR
jgi:hypothetical protein